MTNLGHHNAEPDTRRERTYDERVAVAASQMLTAVVSEVDSRVQESGIDRATLAGRMGIGSGELAQILGGGLNLTLENVAGLAVALNADPEVTFRENIDLTAPQG